MDPENNIRYMVAGNPNGWAGIAKTMRDVDEDKIKDYKEDIDTLLVFTGLFSAVLTAFVVESYQQLSPDPMAPVVKLLERIASQTQSYTITSNTINSTFSPATEIKAAFEPPLPAVRVNQLWFASLVITLITASFSMLVKQWLREYLAMEYTSPHDRIRARQYRHPGLEAWKVLEIAGVLPLLLHLALGLFFLGLCFFTSSVNAGVGKSSTVLVSAWIFLFVSVTLAPVASPRCPYKTAILKNLMIKARRWMSRLLHPASVHAGLYTAFEVLTLGLVSTDPRQPSLSIRQHAIEESEALQQDINELAILQEVDAFLLDDDLLGTTIFDSLLQYHVEPSAIIEFVLQAINLRLKGTPITQPLNSSPDLRHLTKRGWMAVSDIVANTIIRYIGKQVADLQPWYEDAIHLILAQSDHSLTPAASTALVLSIQKSTVSRFSALLASSDSMPDIILPRLHYILDHLEVHLKDMIQNSDIPPSAIIDFVFRLFMREVRNSEATLPLQSIPHLQSLSSQSWTFGVNVVSEAVLHQFDSISDDSPIERWLEDAIYLLLSLSDQPLTDTACKALALCMRQSTAWFLEFVDTLASASELGVYRLLDQFESLSGHLRRQIIHGGDTQPSDIIQLVFHLYVFGRKRALSDVPLLQTAVNLELIPSKTWDIGLGLIQAANSCHVETGATTTTFPSGFLWLEQSIRDLFSICSDFAASPYDPLLHCIRNSMAPRFVQLLSSLVSFSDITAAVVEMFASHLTELIHKAELRPADVVSLVIRLYELEGNTPPLIPPLSDLIDLQSLSVPLWTLSGYVLGDTILHVVESEGTTEGFDLWLEDAVMILLATSPGPLHSTAIRALAALYQEAMLCQRLSRHIQMAASPTSLQYRNILALFRDVCKQVSARDDMNRLLGNLLMSIPCSSKCTHPETSRLALLFHDHIQDHEDWARHYVHLLADRIMELKTEDGARAPGAIESLDALLSCPVPLHQLHADAPGILWNLLTTFSSSDSALHALVDINEEHHSWVKMDVAIERVVSLFADADSEGRRHFLGLKSDQCGNCIENPPFYAYARLNPVRLCGLIIQMHVKVQSDTTLHEAFQYFYANSSQAMKRFREDKFPAVAETEQAATVRLAEKNLLMLDSLEPLPKNSGFEKWAFNFQVRESAFPNELFEQLALFVPEEVARRSKRVILLRAEGVEREMSTTTTEQTEI